MIDREIYAKALDEIQWLRTLLAAERFMHDRLRDRVEGRAQTDEPATRGARKHLRVVR